MGVAFRKQLDVVLLLKTAQALKDAVVLLHNGRHLGWSVTDRVHSANQVKGFARRKTHDGRLDWLVYHDEIDDPQLSSVLYMTGLNSLDLQPII